MSRPNVYRVPIANDGTEHPNWQASGPVEGHATCAAESADEAQTKVADYFKADLGWQVGEPERVEP